MPEKIVVLTFDDAVASHASFVAPLLKSLGFGATFFICEFPPDFAEDKENYMRWEEIAALHAAGFEIGNHTLHHTPVPGCNDYLLASEIEELNARFFDAGIPRPVSFAYPNGPASPDAKRMLKKLGFRYARSVANKAWNVSSDDPLELPGIVVHGNNRNILPLALLTAQHPGEIPVLVYHGVPDRKHPWVDTPPEIFEAEMRFLAEQNYRVLSLRDAEKER